MTCRPHEVQKVQNSDFFTKIMISQESFLEVLGGLGREIYITLEPPRMTSDRKKWFLHFLQLFTTFSLLARMYYRGNGILGIFQPRWALFREMCTFLRNFLKNLPRPFGVYIYDIGRFSEARFRENSDFLRKSAIRAPKSLNKRQVI